MSAAPVDARSAAFISFINNGGTRKLHPDLGGDASPGSTAIYGFPYIIVGSMQPKKSVQFLYADESDGVNHATGESIPFYPIPDEAIWQPHWIEGGEPGDVDLRSQQDRHMIIFDRDNRYLYELYNVFYDGQRWLAGSGAFFDMKRSDRRPDSWTSADAAGLAILPGLVRYDEVMGTSEIEHAFRVTVRATNGFVYPASHRAGANAQALPMGARLRLKASVDLSRFPSEAQRIFRAMKKYGLIVADNGADMYISGTYDTRWNNDVLNPAFAGLTASDFEVVQLGWQPLPPACAYALTRTSRAFPAVGGTSTVGVITGTGCPWSVSGIGGWFVPDVTGGIGGGSVTITVAPNRTGTTRTGVLDIEDHRVTITQVGLSAARPAGDFDADGLADVAVYRPATGTWFALGSSTDNGSFVSRGWGANNDVPVPGDFDGDGLVDPAVFRRSTGTWFILKSSTNYKDWLWFGWGTADDQPVVGDYDGDGSADAAVYRPSNGTWYVRPSTGSPCWSVAFGSAGDRPVPGDYDGDGRTDLAVYRPATGTWFILMSVSHFSEWYFRGWGVQANGDLPVPGDYDGDGKTDIAVYRPATGTWFALKSSAGDLDWTWLGWGTAADLPAPSDYDGDGRTDLAVYRPATGEWWVKPSSGAMPWSVVFGAAGDVPLQGMR